ncbi:MAG: biotin transporter BioY [Bacteroidetes bacterium]|nr:biotin transporter BioY [Bacteroidota bacterium]
MITHSSSTSRIDALSSDQASLLIQILAIGLFAIATAIGAQVRIYLWEVPITLQTLFVYGSGLVLGARNGSLSMVLYLCLGLFFPVYAGSGHGLTYLMSATSAGYLFGMPLSAFVIGIISRHTSGFFKGAFAVCVGSLVLFTCGVIWMHFVAMHTNWWYSIEVGWLRFIGFDIAKILVVSLLYGGLRRWI